MLSTALHPQEPGKCWLITNPTKKNDNIVSMLVWSFWASDSDVAEKHHLQMV